MNEEKLKNSVMACKLVTGEEVIGISIQIDEHMQTFGLPYVIVKRKVPGQEHEVPVMEKFFPYVKDRIFPIPRSSILFTKDAKENFSESFLKNAKIQEPKEYQSLLEEIEKRQTPEPQILDTEYTYSVHMDEDLRVIHPGDNTRH